MPLRLSFVSVCFQIGGDRFEIGIREVFPRIAEHRDEMSDLVRLAGMSDIAIRSM